MKKNNLGFTILEMLVVLVIVSMISTILFQAMDQILKLQHRFGIAIAQSQQGAMRIDWIRQLVQGLQADYSDGQYRFAGTKNKISGLTSNFPSDQYGPIQSFVLQIINEKDSSALVLYEKESRPPIQLANWQEKKGEFIFVDKKGKTWETWPPETMEPSPQLPNKIYLHLKGLDATQIIVFIPRAGDLTPPRLSDLLGKAQ